MEEEVGDDDTEDNDTEDDDVEDQNEQEEFVIADDLADRITILRFCFVAKIGQYSNH